MNTHIIHETTEVAAERSPVLAVRFGRGRTGGTTFLDYLIQRARRDGRAVLIGDGDRNNATLSSFYPPGTPGGALQPRSGDISDASEWVTEICSRMASERTSMVLDMGGGDKVLSEHANDMALPEFCAASGVQTLAIYMIGPDLEDLRHVVNIFEAGYFRSDRAFLVMNESMVKAGKASGGAFDFVLEDERFREMADAVEVIAMPKLACMDAMRKAGLTFFEAAAGRKGADGVPLSLGHQFMVKTWLNRMDEALERFDAWLP